MNTVTTWVLVSAAILFTGCDGCSGSTSVMGSRPCMRASAPAGCGMACGGSAGSCPTGLYCDGTAHCTADCDVRNGAGCPAGMTCAPTGQCGTQLDGTVAVTDLGPPMDFGIPDNTCASVTIGTTHQTPNVILLVDRSGSMDNTFDMGMSRWQVLYNALMASPGGLVSSLQDAVRFGLVMFTGRGTGCPDLMSVMPPVLHNYDPINAVYMPATPGTNTPTGESLAAVVAMLSTMTLPPGPTIILLATDGEPNTCTSTTDHAGGQAMAIAAAMNAQSMGYVVDAIGVATDVALANLSQVAMAGGGTAVSVTDSASLAAALTSIVGGALSCTLLLDGMVDPAMACSGDVRINDMPISCGDPNGWDVVDMNHIVLRGTSCDTLLHTSGATVTATFPCTVLLH